MDRDRVRQQMESHSTEQLSSIYGEHDTSQYVPEVFEVIAELLLARGVEVPELGSPGGAAQGAPQSVAPSNVPDSGGGFLSFRTMISGELIRLLYLIGLLGITGFGLMVILGGQLASGLLVIVVGNLAWRLICEAGILLFGMHQALVSIDRKIG